MTFYTHGVMNYSIPANDLPIRGGLISDVPRYRSHPGLGNRAGYIPLPHHYFKPKMGAARSGMVVQKQHSKTYRARLLRAGYPATCIDGKGIRARHACLEMR